MITHEETLAVQVVESLIDNAERIGFARVIFGKTTIFQFPSFMFLDRCPLLFGFSR
jgi:hypothetical protein